MSAAPEAPAIPGPFAGPSRATEAFVDELIGQHDSGPRRYSPAPCVLVSCEHCGQAEPEGWVRTLAHVQRDLVAVHLRRQCLFEQEDADTRELGDLHVTVYSLVGELVDIYTRGILR